MAPTVLLTLGRLPKGLDVARSFARAGWRVVVAEPFAWHLSRVSAAVAKSWRVTAPNSDRQRYLDDIARIVAAEGVELVVPVSEEAMHVAGVKRALPPGVRFYGMDQQLLLAVHDKLNFALQAAAYDLPVPLSFRGDEPGAATLAAAQSVVVKPRFSCSGLGVTILQPGAILAGRDRTADCLVQAFVAGEVCSTFSLAHEGRVQTTVVYRGTVMSGTVAVAFERIDAPMVATWVETFVRRSGWSGSIAFDVVVDAAGRVHGIECNPRMTSGVHFLHPDDLAPAMVRPDPTDPLSRAAADAAVLPLPDRDPGLAVPAPGVQAQPRISARQPRRHLELARPVATALDAADLLPDPGQDHLQGTEHGRGRDQGHRLVRPASGSHLTPAHPAHDLLGRAGRQPRHGADLLRRQRREVEPADEPGQDQRAFGLREASANAGPRAEAEGDVGART